MSDSSGNDYYYLHDHLYSPAVLVEDNGTVVERYEYDAYGVCRVLEPNFAPDPDGLSDYANCYLFTGRTLISRGRSQPSTDVRLIGGRSW